MWEWKMREQAAGVENVEVKANLRINWDGVKLIQIRYLTYEIHIIRQYNIGVVYCIILIFSSFNLFDMCRLVYILDVAFVIQDSNKHNV